MNNNNQKKDKNSFQNRAAKKFNDAAKADLMSEEEVYDVLEKDIDIIIDQVAKNQAQQGKYPRYVTNIFANISSAKFFYEYVVAFRSDFTKETREALKNIISSAFKDSIMNKYQFQVLENDDRNNYLRDTFKMLATKDFKIAKRLELETDKTKELIIQAYMEPKYSAKQVAKLFDKSNISDKKKMKILRKLYKGERFVDVIGAALTVDFTASDFVHMAYEFIMDKKKKKRSKYLEAYAINFKKVKKAATSLVNTTFVENNKKVIKKLIRKDRGYKKAFEVNLVKTMIKRDKDKEKDKKGNKKSNTPDKDFSALNNLFKKGSDSGK